MNHFKYTMIAQALLSSPFTLADVMNLAHKKIAAGVALPFTLGDKEHPVVIQKNDNMITINYDGTQGILKSLETVKTVAA